MKLFNNDTSKAKFVILLPFIGSIVFILLYALSALLYPGGNQWDKTSKGFSWTKNFWCNLMNATALNGQVNNARPVALSAMFIMCFTLICFWYIFPLIARFHKTSRIIVQSSGIISMVICGLLMATRLHDTVINLSSLFGLIALTGTFTGLYKLKWTGLLIMGLFTILLIVLNNIFYYNEMLLIYLPVLQKFTFLYFLVWISLISIRSSHSKSFSEA